MFYLFNLFFHLVVDGKKTQNTASLWRMKQDHKGEEYFDLERMHQHQSRGELELVLTLELGDGSVKKYVCCLIYSKDGSQISVHNIKRFIDTVLIGLSGKIVPKSFQ